MEEKEMQNKSTKRNYKDIHKNEPPSIVHRFGVNRFIQEKC